MNRRKALQKTGLFAGATLLVPSALAIFQSCQDKPRLGWEPLFFTEDEAKTISMMVDMILPRTDTPGALDVNVDMFIDKVFAETYDKEAQEKKRAEIAQFNEDCKTNFGDVFINLNEADRQKALEAAEKSSGKFGTSFWGVAVKGSKPVGFYRSMKSMAIGAYFSSEEIGENVLNYLPVPGEYEGCIPVSEVGNRWSL